MRAASFRFGDFRLNTLPLGGSATCRIATVRRGGELLTALCLYLSVTGREFVGPLALLWGTAPSPANTACGSNHRPSQREGDVHAIS